jgi:hypothetical protein
VIRRDITLLRQLIESSECLPSLPGPAHQRHRLYVPQLRPITYPEHFEIRLVSTNGGVRWNKRWVNVSHILATLPVGFEPLASGT